MHKVWLRRKYIPSSKDLIKTKRELRGIFVAIMGGHATNRRLRLIQLRTRAISATGIHELLLTDGAEIKPGDIVDRVSFVGFFEVTLGGVLKVGEEARVNEKLLGEVIGFDLTHYPNHMNILLKGPKLVDGMMLGLAPGDEIVFDMPIER